MALVDKLTNFEASVKQDLSTSIKKKDNNYKLWSQIHTLQTLVTEVNASITSVEETLSFNSTDTITAYDVVTSTGKVADSSTLSHRGKIIGIAKASVSSGFIGVARGIGSITNASWSWTIGDKIFLNGTSLSTTAPSSGFSQFIGTAIASDTIDIQLGIPILL